MRFHVEAGAGENESRCGGGKPPRTRDNASNSFLASSLSASRFATTHRLSWNIQSRLFVSDIFIRDLWPLF